MNNQYQPRPITIGLIAIGIAVVGLIFSQPEYYFANWQEKLSDMRFFGIEQIQYKWMLAASVVLALYAIYRYATEKP